MSGLSGVSGVSGRHFSRADESALAGISWQRMAVLFFALADVEETDGNWLIFNKSSLSFLSNSSLSISSNSISADASENVSSKESPSLSPTSDVIWCSST